MPWKLIPPRPGKTPFWYVRGKYLGIALDNSTGTPDERAAKRILKTWREIAIWSISVSGISPHMSRMASMYCAWPPACM
jgi:hypothetical protein